MSETINLAEARRKLPELTDQASAGEAYIVSRRGREMAVLIGIEEYRRLKALEERQRQQDFDLLLAPPEAETLTEGPGPRAGDQSGARSADIAL